MISWWRRRFVWRYVGTVSAATNRVDLDGAEVLGGRMRGYWVLEETASGARRSTTIGDAGISPSATERRARVSAWVRGGPLPPLDDSFANTPPRDAGLRVIDGGAA